jgi:hypothetical protein
VQEKNGEDLVGILEHATGLRSDISVRRWYSNYGK